MCSLTCILTNTFSLAATVKKVSLRRGKYHLLRLIHSWNYPHCLILVEVGERDKKYFNLHSSKLPGMQLQIHHELYQPTKLQTLLSLLTKYYTFSAFPERTFWQWAMVSLTPVPRDQAWCAVGLSKTPRYEYFLTFIYLLKLPLLLNTSSAAFAMLS